MPASPVQPLGSPDSPAMPPASLRTREKSGNPGGGEPHPYFMLTKRRNESPGRTRKKRERRRNRTRVLEEDDQKKGRKSVLLLRRHPIRLTMTAVLMTQVLNHRVWLASSARS